MDLSIIIATHNRAPLAAACLDALMPQTTGKNVEVIVIDSASTPDHRSKLKDSIGKLQEDSAIRLHFITLEEPGVAKARNAGVARAASDWIATLDDEAMASEQWLEGALGAIAAASPETGIIQGRINPRWPDTHPDKIGPRWRRFLSLIQFDGEFEFTDKPVCSGANMLIRAGTLRSVGGYNENYGRVGSNLASGIDTILAVGVRKAGMRICYSDRFPVEHVILEERLHVDWIRRRSKMDGHAVGRVLMEGRNFPHVVFQFLKSLFSIGVFSSLLLFSRNNHEMLIRRDVNIGLLSEILQAGRNQKEAP